MSQSLTVKSSSDESPMVWGIGHDDICEMIKKKKYGMNWKNSNEGNINQIVKNSNTKYLVTTLIATRTPNFGVKDFWNLQRGKPHCHFRRWVNVAIARTRVAPNFFCGKMDIESIT